MMATPKLMVAVQPFVAIDGTRYTPIAEGDRLPATHPLVKANPSMFKPVKP